MKGDAIRLIVDKQKESIVITPELFIKLMQETMGMMIAYTIEFYGVSPNDVTTVVMVNKVLSRTYDNHEWLEKYIAYLYKVAAEIEKESK